MLKYLADFVKRVLNKKTSSSSPAVSWKDILKEEPGIVPLKKRRTMLLPSRRVLLWKTEEEEEKTKKKQAQSGINIAFRFEYDGISHTVQTQRPFDQLLISGALPKISALMQKKALGKANALQNEVWIEVNPNSDYEISDGMTTRSFADDTNITSLLVHNEEFRIIRNGTPIRSVSLELTPIVGQHCMPTIDYNKNDTPVRIHWFVKNELQIGKVGKSGPSKKEVDLLDLSFINENDRVFALNGYTFKHTRTYYTPEENDVGRLIAVVVDTGRDNPVNAAISSRPTSEAPEEVITNEQVKWCKTHELKETENVIRVMSYNILADLYLNLTKPQEYLFFKYCPKAYQRYFYRIPIFLKQLLDFADADVSIFFLQEVDMNRHKNFIKPMLDTIGFSSEISKKLRQISEGVAIIYDQKRFRSIFSSSYSLAELTEREDVNADVRLILNSSKESQERFTTRPTIVQIVILEHIKTETIFVCANTHLHHNPLDEHVKALQALVCTRKLLEVYNERRLMEPEKNIKCIFGGDFNSTPDGPAYQLMLDGFLPKDNEHWRCDEKIAAADLRIEEKMTCLTGTPAYTNYTAQSQTEGFVGCLDYIWGIGVDSVRICPMPDHQKVIQHIALPSVNSPSDHLPIICDIKL